MTEIDSIRRRRIPLGLVLLVLPFLLGGNPFDSYGLHAEATHSPQGDEAASQAQSIRDSLAGPYRESAAIQNSLQDNPRPFRAELDSPCRLTIAFRDHSNAQPISARVGVFDSRGVPIAPVDPEGHLFQNVLWWSYFYCEGSAELEVPVGPVTIRAGRGFEYRPVACVLDVRADTSVVLELERFVDMNAIGWFSADTHVHIRHGPVNYDIAPEQVITVMDAEELNFINSMERQDDFTGALHPASKANRLLYFSKEQRNAHFGHLTLIGLKQWIPDRGCAEPGRACGQTLNSVIADEVHAQGNTLVIIAHPCTTTDLFDIGLWPGGGLWRGAPMDLVRDALDAVDLLSYSSKPPPVGIADYMQALNAGFRVPPSAGTDAVLCSGECRAPGGYRVYVHPPDGEPFHLDSWVEGLRQGRCFVTNYPVFERFEVAGEIAGGIVHHRGEQLEGLVSVRCILPMHRVDIIGDGRILETFLPAPGSDSTRIEGTFTFDPTALRWMVARATGDANGWHVVNAGGLFAQTGPIYFEIGTSDRGRRRDSNRNSVELPDDPVGEAAAYFLKRISDEDLMFSCFGLFPGNSRAAYEAARDEARTFFGLLHLEPPEPFSLLEPTRVSWAHGHPWVRTQTPTFRWERTVDPDPGDSVTYTLSWSTDSDFEAATVVTGITDTTYTVPDSLALEDDALYYLHLCAVDIAGYQRAADPSTSTFVVDLTPASAVGEEPTTAWSISQVWPNPFNPTAQINYVVNDEGTDHRLEIYDPRGRLVRRLFSGRQPAGTHTESWNGQDDSGQRVASGVYFARLTPAGGSAVSRKIVFIK
jgi:hypothetical protein